MIDLSDLGIAPAPSASANTESEVIAGDYQPDEQKRRTIVPGSVLARSLYSTWGGDPVLIVDSAPGSGKTTLLVDLLETLTNRNSGLSIIVATPTRRGGADLAERLAKAIKDNCENPVDKTNPVVVFGTRNYTPFPEGCYERLPESAKAHVTVRTIASCASSPPECDVMVFDEGYQATFSDMMSAADAAKQIVVVGDPGQIGPVVTTETKMWDNLTDGPHLRGPAVLAHRDDVTVLRLDATYRLGQDTVDAILPLYDFPFSSLRPDRHITNRSGERLPELSAMYVDGSASRADIPLMKAVAEKAASFVGLTVHETQPDGTVTESRVRERDVAVVVSHNNQRSAVRAILDSMVMDGIEVGTADSLQGGQWHAVVALDPVVGHTALSEHQFSEGRLCVMASRHMTSMVWVTVADWADRLGAYADEQPQQVANGLAVRRALTAVKS